MLWWLAGMATAGYGLLAALSFFYQRALIYPMPALTIEPRLAGATLEDIPGPEGTHFYALWSPARPGSPTLVHFHGNGEDLASQAPLVSALREAGIGVFAVEYPGYGLCKKARITEDSIYAAAETALAHLRTALGVPRDATILQGQSLGTGVAAEMARRGYGARLVLISPYTSMIDMASRLAPFLPVRWLVQDKYETLRKAPSLALPALVIHGTDDELIPVSMGRRIAQLLPHSELVLVDGGHHADLFDVDPRLFTKIAAFAQGSGIDPR